MATICAQPESTEANFVPHFTRFETDAGTVNTQFAESVLPAPIATPIVNADSSRLCARQHGLHQGEGFSHWRFTIEVVDPETHEHLWTGPIGGEYSPLGSS
jgi:hypothetical protein